MERLVLAGKLRREEVFIIAKPPPTCPGKNLTSSAVAASLQKSLQQLRTSYVDCLMVHHSHEETEENFKSMWRQMEALVDEGRALSLGLRGDWLHWASPNNTAGLCPKCKFFLHEARHMPMLIFTEDDRTQVPQTKADIELWKRLGIVVIGGGSRKKHISKYTDIGMPHRHALRRAVELGVTGPGPVLYKSRNPNHIIENQRIFDFSMPVLPYSESCQVDREESTPFERACQGLPSRTIAACCSGDAERC